MKAKETKIDSMGTESVRIDSGIVSIVRQVKKHTGLPMGRFIEDAIMEKAHKLPQKVKDKFVIQDR